MNPSDVFRRFINDKLDSQNEFKMNSSAMNSSAYYLTYILYRFAEDVLDLHNESKRRKKKRRELSDLDKGILAGRYIIIGKLLNRLASMGIFEALPVSLQQHITPSSLVEDLERGELANIWLLGDAFMQKSKEVAYKSVDLRALFEEIITEGIALQGKQSEFDEGQLMGYSFCLLTLYNQAWVFVPKLFYSLPKKLRNFIPEHLRSVKKSDLGL